MKTFYRFNPANTGHQETCGFSFGIESCGKPAMGYCGKRLDDRTYLCMEHFNYASRHAGIPFHDIKTEGVKK